MARCAQIFCLMRSWLCGLVHVRRLEETNKKRRRLMDIAPHCGEPRISYVYVLYAMLSMLFMYLFS
jgi:hypothetical protein